jgi:hypothetical protein
LRPPVPRAASQNCAGAIKEGKLKVFAARYDIASGKISLLTQTSEPQILSLMAVLRTAMHAHP